MNAFESIMLTKNTVTLLSKTFKNLPKYSEVYDAN